MAGNYGFHGTPNLLTSPREQPMSLLARCLSLRWESASAACRSERGTGGRTMSASKAVALLQTLSSARHGTARQEGSVRTVLTPRTNHRARVRCHFDPDQWARYSQPRRRAVEPITVELPVHGAETCPAGRRKTPRPSAVRRAPL